MSLLPKQLRAWWPVGLILLAWALLFLPFSGQRLPMQLWDESRLGVGALEMLRHRDWVVVRYAGQPDLWSTKPPLVIWAQALSMAVLGPSEAAARLPTTLAVLATVLVVYRAGLRWLGSRWAATLAALALLTAPGYLRLHVGLTADYDAPLTLWTTLLAVAWYDYLHTGRARYARLTGLWALLAVLTKGVAGVLLGPALLLFTLLTGNARRLGHPPVAQGLGLALLGTALWYGGREVAAPGYLRAVWEYELVGRAAAALEGHEHGFFYYFERLATKDFYWWLLPAVGGWAVGWQQPAGSVYRRLAWFSAVLPLGLLLLLSAVRTKLPWYPAPALPLLALAVGLGAHWARPRPRLRWALGLLAGLALADRLYYLHALLPRLGHEQAASYAADLWRRLPPGQAPHYLAYDGYQSTLDFYRLAAERRGGGPVLPVFPDQLDLPRPGRTVLVCGRQQRRQWEQHWQARVLQQTDSCATLRLQRRRRNGTE